MGTRLDDTNAEASVEEKGPAVLEETKNSSHLDWSWILLYLEIFTGDRETSPPPRGPQIRFLGSVNPLKFYARFCI